MREAGARSRQRLSPFRQNLQTRLECQPSQGDDDRAARQQRPFAGQVLAAIRKLSWERPIPGWSASAGRRDERAGEAQSIVGRSRVWLVGEPGCVQGGKQEVPRLVARENSSGAVAPVSGGSEADEEDSS